MQRKEIQAKTGLTRKAIDYYEDKGLIKPEKSENGYKDYSEEDLKKLNKISSLRALNLSISDIDEYLISGGKSLSSVLRKKQHLSEMEEKRNKVIQLLVKGESQEIIKDRINQIKAEESVYDRLLRIFPDYFGQMFFVGYEKFLDEPLDEEGIEAFNEYVEFLDSLPSFKLEEAEEDCIEALSSGTDNETIKDINNKKIEALENPDEWLEENKEAISHYEEYKNSNEYKNSPVKAVEEKLRKYMLENNYYEKAIPLIRKFSRSYDEYYKKLLKANEKYLKKKNIE